MEFKDRLKELRTKVGLTQKQLAVKLGFSLSIVNKWENGKKLPGYDALMLLANFFDESLDYITGRTD